MGTTWRRTFVRLLIGTAATVAFLVLFLREVDLSDAWKTMSSLPAWTLFASLGLIGANVFFMTLRWKYLLEGAGYRVDKRKLFSTIAVVGYPLILRRNAREKARGDDDPDEPFGPQDDAVLADGRR